jgi:hypothetical protein
MYMYGLACVHLWTNGLVDGRTDGRTDSDIVLSRHDRKKILKIFPRVRENLT